ncbi:Hypothetical protein A7982_11420 [Minicystis rosea]|nr:Hypothetical protein A7982_11420 [Minicystis rosea]
MSLRALRRPALLIAALAIALAGHDAAAFPHVVKKGETLAAIAERTYGRVQMEQILVAANGLDAGGGIPIVAGMRLEVPAVGHHRVSAGRRGRGSPRSSSGTSGAGKCWPCPMGPCRGSRRPMGRS